jgi:hypothetical protein
MRGGIFPTTLPETFLILRRIERDITKNDHTSCYSRYSRHIFMRLVLYRQTFEKPQILNFMKIRLVGAELFLVDRQTDRNDEANSRFPQFCESAKKEKKNPCG